MGVVVDSANSESAHGTPGSTTSKHRPLIVQCYEQIFKSVNLADQPDTFWNEFFLLKPKVIELQSYLEVDSIADARLPLTFKNIVLLSEKCLDVLKSNQNEFRVVVSLYNLYLLFYSLSRKSVNGDNCLKVSINNINHVSFLAELVSVLNLFLKNNQSSDVTRRLSLQILLVLVTNYDYLNDNPIFDHVVASDVFNTLLALIRITDNSEQSFKIVKIIFLILNYKKYDPVSNPSVSNYETLNYDEAVGLIGKVIVDYLSSFCSEFAKHVTDTYEPSSWQWLSSLTNMVGSMFVAEDESVYLPASKTNNTIMLALYETIHLHQNFGTILKNHENVDGKSHLLNLLAVFFQYCSIVMQDIKSENGFSAVKMCFLILRCISENQTVNSVIHDDKFRIQVQLYRLPMRHRKSSIEKSPIPQPLIYFLLDLLTEFILTHLMKKFPLELYYYCVGIIHRIICYQKKNRIRLSYQWKWLWNAFISLLKFLVQNETQFVKKINIFPLCLQVVNIFNIFITYGYAFLPTSGSYDELYYEIIRLRQVFADLYTIALKHTNSDVVVTNAVTDDQKPTSQKLCNSLINIRAIIKHFVPKIDQWMESENISTPNESEILNIVRINYDSLTLKLQKSIDNFETFNENPKYADFFTILVRNVVQDTDLVLDDDDKHVHEALNQYSVSLTSGF